MATSTVSMPLASPGLGAPSSCTCPAWQPPPGHAPHLYIGGVFLLDLLCPGVGFAGAQDELRAWAVKQECGTGARGEAN